MNTTPATKTARAPRNSGVTAHTSGGVTYYIVGYSPRGFANELDLDVHTTLEGALKSVSEIENNTSSWVASKASTTAMIRSANSDRETFGGPTWAELAARNA